MPLGSLAFRVPAALLWGASRCREAYYRPQANHYRSASLHACSYQKLLTSCWACCTNSNPCCYLTYASYGFLGLLISVWLGPIVDFLDSVAQEKANGFCDPTRFLQTSLTSVCLRASAVDKQPLPGPGCAGGRSHNPGCLSPTASEVAHTPPP